MKIKKVEKKKEPIAIGKMNTHQWGIIYIGGGTSPTETAGQFKQPIRVIKQWKKERN